MTGSLSKELRFVSFVLGAVVALTSVALIIYIVQALS